MSGPAEWFRRLRGHQNSPLAARTRTADWDMRTGLVRKVEVRREVRARLIAVPGQGRRIEPVAAGGTSNLPAKSFAAS